MNQYVLPITCIECGGNLVPIAGGTTNGLETRAVAECERCRIQHLISVTLSTTSRRRPITPHGTIAHGTRNGYHQHRRAGTTPCTECLAARALDKQLRRVG